VLAANTALAEIMGYDLAEPGDRAVTDVARQVWLDPNERSVFVNILENQGVVKGYECRFKRKNGAPIWVSLTTRRVCGADRNALYYEGFVQDITERKQAEQALREAVQFNREMMDSARDGIIVYGPDLCYRLWNRAMEELTGLLAKDVLGRHPLELFPFLDEYGVIDRLKRILAGGPPETIDLAYSVTATSRSGWTSNVSCPLRNAAGEIIGVIAIVREISDRKLAERQLQESERRLRALYNGAPLGIGVADSRTGKLLQVNPAYCRITGWSSDDLCRMDFPRRTHPDDVPAQVENLRCLRTGEISGFQMDKRYLRPDGSIVWGSLTVVPLWESGASPTFHLNMVEEITARKQAEENLRERNRYIETILENAPVGFAVITIPDGRIAFAGSSFWEIHGVPRGGVATLREFFNSFQIDLDTRAEIQDQVRTDVASGSPAPSRWENVPITTAAGEHKFVTVLQIPIPGQKLLVCAAQDVTERKLAEEALRSHEAMMQSIVSSAMDAIISVNERQRIVVFNRAAEKIFRCPAAEALGSSLDRFIPAERREAHREHIRNFGVTGRTRCAAEGARALVAVRANGERFPVEIAVSRVHAGEEELYTAILRDITERKLAEQKLRRSEKQLRALAARVQSVTEAERLRISRELHDQLGQSLTAIKMELDWLVRKQGPRRKPWFEQVQRAMQLVDSTIGLVRKLSTELRPATLDTFGLCAALEFQVEEFQRRTGIQCCARMPQGKFDLSPEQRIAVFRICQEALTNIARHAGASQVQVTLEETRRQASFTIRDDGKGFAMESLDHKGALGILGMRERALMLGGKLDIDSAPGAGTQVTLRIPLHSGIDEAERT
jgi:PAS domain S-box-containing protein